MLTCTPHAAARRIRSGPLLLIGALLTGACVSASEVMPGPACTTELASAIQPADTTIAVGATFSGSARATTCGGTRIVAQTFSWRSLDSTVVRVDAATGRVTARATGTTRLVATGQGVSATSTVRVIAP